MIEQLNSTLLSFLNFLKDNTIARWVASKSLIVSAMATFIVTCHNHIAGWISQLIAYALTKLDAVSLPVTTNFSFTFDGVAAYLCTHLRIVDCLSFVVSILVLKITLRIIGGFLPFLRIVR